MTENDKKFARIQKLIAGGLNTHAAIKKVGCSPGFYYHRLDKQKAAKESQTTVKPKRKYTRRAKVETLEVPEPSTQVRVAVFVGTPAQVAEAMRGVL